MPDLPKTVMASTCGGLVGTLSARRRRTLATATPTYLDNLAALLRTRLLKLASRPSLFTWSPIMATPSPSADSPEPTAALLETTETLVWQLLDDQIDDAQVAQLEKLLAESEAARGRYLDCMQLHIDLVEHFAEQAPKTPGDKPSVPILSQLLPEDFPGPLPTPKQ